MSFMLLDEETACAALRAAGLDLSPAQIRVEPREDRWLVSLPGERVAWFAADASGRERLNRECRVLRLLAERCSFRVPRILFESDEGWDLRAIVPGLCDPWGLYRRTLTDVDLARRIGRALGSILVEQHTRVEHHDVGGWLPTRPAWPESSDAIRRRLPYIIDDRALVADIDRTLAAYDRVPSRLTIASWFTVISACTISRSIPTRLKSAACSTMTGPVGRIATTTSAT